MATFIFLSNIFWSSVPHWCLVEQQSSAACEYFLGISARFTASQFAFLAGLGSDTLARTILSVPGTHLPFAANQSWMSLEQWAISSGR